MKILYGGTFNPPTKAHYKIIAHLLAKYPAATITLLPTANHYEKAEIIDFHHRFKMLEILAKKFDSQVFVSDFENTLSEYRGTNYTLAHFPNHYFIMGADNFITIHKWIDYQELIKNNKFIIIPRDGIDISAYITANLELSTYQDNFIILDDFASIDLSSSKYRKSKNSSLLLAEVNNYIQANNLY